MYKPTVQLIGEDGNVFNIIGLVSRELKRAGLKELAIEFQNKAVQCESYDEVLRLVMGYIEAYNRKESFIRQKYIFENSPNLYENLNKK